MRRWSLEPIRRITARLRQSVPDVPIIVFPRAIGPGYRDFAEQSVGNALSIEQGIDPDWARDMLQPKIVVQGNLDPRWLVVGGEGMRTAIRRIMDSLGGKPFIFNLGHGCLPETPPDHVAELIETVRGHR
jgi:uroporphyrinogen decarboxylase